MTVSLIGTTWNWDDSGDLSIAQPGGIQVGDTVMALLGNHGDTDVGAGFVPAAGMPATPRLFLHSYPHPGNGGTLDWWYWTFAGTEPSPFHWTCADILVMGVVMVFRTDAGPILSDTFTTKDNANVSSQPTNSLTPAAGTFLVGAWYTESGGTTVNWTGDGSLATVINAVDGGTLRQTELVQIADAPVGAFTKTATLTPQQDGCAYMTTWTGTLAPASTVHLLPILGVGA